MATRPAYLIENGKVIRKDYDFTWISGLSASQKQKCALSLHDAIRSADASANPLEVSTKSNDSLGVKMSAFNLMLDGFHLENVFQSGKVFAFGGPFPNLMHMHPREAKHHACLRESGTLIGFRYQGIVFPLEPKTLFYDYIYIKAIWETLTDNEIQQIRNYTHFTDIEFNPAKSINTQAKTAAEIRLMLDLYGGIPDMNEDTFLWFHREYVFA